MWEASMGNLFLPDVMVSHHRMVSTIVSCFGYILGGKGVAVDGTVVAVLGQP